MGPRGWGHLPVFPQGNPGQLPFYLLLFADDGLVFTSGEAYQKILLALLLYLEILEVPQDYTVDITNWRLGISERKMSWLKEWSKWAISQGHMLGRDFKAGLGRLGFLAGIAKRARPFLAPLYSSSSRVRGGSFFELRLSTKLAIKFFEESIGDRPMRPLSSWPSVLGEVFRVDAMADLERVAVVVWETFHTTDTLKARWFSVKLNRTTAPYLYVKGEPFKTIASAELLAVTLAIMVFGPAGKWRKGAGRVAVTGFTDNISNAYLLDKYLTTKFPASLVLMELSKQLELYDLNLNLAWIPREQNEPADDLSKDRFEKFDLKCRVEVDMTKLDYLVLPKMLEAAMSLDEEIQLKKTSKQKPSFADKAPADQKLRLTQPW